MLICNLKLNFYFLIGYAPLVMNVVKQEKCTLIINLQDNFKRAIEQVGESVSIFTYPIFQENINSRPELVASSVAIELDGKYFLCTARHVIEGLNKSLPTYCANSNLSQGGIFIELNSKVIFTKNSKNVELDLCLIDISAIKEKFIFLNGSKIALDSNFSGKSFNVLLGYPISQNKGMKAIDPSRNEVTTGFLTVAVKLDSNIDFLNFKGKTEYAHVGFRYHVDYEKQILPFPRGMSGCGVWNIPSVYDTENFSLAGIFIEYHKKEKIGFATKANYIKKLSTDFVK